MENLFLTATYIDGITKMNFMSFNKTGVVFDLKMTQFDPDARDVDNDEVEIKTRFYYPEYRDMSFADDVGVGFHWFVEDDSPYVYTATFVKSGFQITDVTSIMYDIDSKENKMVLTVGKEECTMSLWFNYHDELIMFNKVKRID